MAGSGTAHLRPELNPLISVENLTVEFPLRKGLKVHAVSGISFDILDGETLGLVGESGCVKSTPGRALMQLPRPSLLSCGTIVRASRIRCCTRNAQIQVCAHNTI